MKLQRKLLSSLFFFSFPCIGYLAIVYGYPFFETIRLSLYEGNLIMPTDSYNFVGFGNYLKLPSPVVAAALWHTFIFTGITVSASVLLGLAGAILLNEQFKGRRVFRALIILPWAIPNAIVGVFWRWLYHSLGPINTLFAALGLISTPIEFVSADFGLIFVSIARSWKATPFAVMCILAALQATDAALYESARIDGASALQRFRYITLPSIKPVCFSVIILLTIWTANNFGLIYTLPMGGGYVLNRIETLSVAIYRTLITEFNVGLASAMSVLGIAVLSIPTYLYLKIRYR